MGAKRLGGKRLGGKRLGGETTRGRNGLGAKRPGFYISGSESRYHSLPKFLCPVAHHKNVISSIHAAVSKNGLKCCLCIFKSKS